ncbi:FkbM family methyltransferase [Streptomyces solincola]|uniref:FkbM family methyltransferase n=1 Tax=Streptomyces solincola TaxID=2100817 RepID=A0A2S9Q1K5_9ACTN|nr:MULTISPECIES: FkbM family methyltransferase [Streptomyces]PRH80493.1 FkbM family methyltransferase [Streptomyces solincola]
MTESIPDPAENHTLPDGRVISGLNAETTKIVWHEVSESIYLTDLQHLRAGDTVIDIGAHLGLSSLFVSDRVPGVRVIACEPARATYACLARNFADHLPGGIAVNKAVADRPGTAEFTFYPADETMATLQEDEGDDQRNIEAVLTNLGVDAAEQAAYWENFRAEVERYTVPVTTVAELIAEHGVETVDLLKIDVERSELAVLAGVGDENWPRIRNIAVEVHDVDDGLARAVDLLKDKGFQVEYQQQEVFKGGSVYIVLARRD